MVYDSKKSLQTMKELSIHIAEPCHEDWSKMTTAEKGRHCKSCQTDVIDFTKMHKAGIADHLLKNQGSICGRFTKDQLDVNLLPPRKNRLFLKWAALFLGMVPLAGYSQQTQSNIKTEQIVKGKRVIAITHKKPSTDTKNTISGTIIDANREVLIHANIVGYDKGGNIIQGAPTDLDGKFEIDIIPNGYMEVSYVGYTTKKIMFSSLVKTNGGLEIVLEEGYLLGDVEIKIYKSKLNRTMMGLISVVHATSEKKSWIGRQINKFKKLITKSHFDAVKNKELSQENAAIEITETESEIDDKDIFETSLKTKNSIKLIKNTFPNPTIGKVTIELSKEIINGEVHVMNENNQLIKKQQVKGWQFSIDISHHPQGAYIISIIEEGKLVGSEMIVKI